jgi:hypothetical protein
LPTPFEDNYSQQIRIPLSLGLCFVEENFLLQSCVGPVLLNPISLEALDNHCMKPIADSVLCHMCKLTIDSLDNYMLGLNSEAFTCDAGLGLPCSEDK